MRPAAHVVGVEERLDVVPERARLARAAVVVRGLAHEIEPLRGARARRVEEVAVVLDRVRPLEPRASRVERAPRVVVEERRAPAATRQAPLLQPEDEDGVEAARAGAQEVDHGDAPRVVACAASQRGTLDRRQDVLAAQVSAELAPALELGEQPPQRLVRPQVEPARGVRRRPLQAVGVPQHSLRELPHRLDRVGGLTQLLERGQRRAAKALSLVDHALRRLDCVATEASLDEVDGAPLEPRERRAEVAEEVAARPSSPREAQQRRERVHERRLREAQLAVDRVRDAEGAQHRLERAADPLVARHHEPDPLGRHAAAGEREHLLGDELERAAASGSLEEAHHTVERRCFSRLVGEQRPLEMRERRRRDRSVARRQLLDVAGGQAGEILGRPTERGEDRPSRLVRQRDRDLGPRGQRLEQCPLRAGEVLEPVGEDRLALPGVEVGPQALDGVTAQQAAIPARQAVELVAVAGIERAECALDGVGRQ